jgi:hypothetical protein
MKDPAQYPELEIAEAIVDALEDAAVVRVSSDDPDAIRYAVRATGVPLQLVVLGRDALRKLAADPLRQVKLDYLRRDLTRSMNHRAEFVYPRPHPGVLRAAARRRDDLRFDDSMAQLFTTSALLGRTPSEVCIPRHR